MRGRLLGVATTFALLIAVVVLYFIFILEEAPPGVAATVTGTTAQLTLQTDAAYGHNPYPDWVTYMARDPSGKWQHSTILKIPAGTRYVHVTLYEYDTATGLRNPFFAYVRGTVGGVIQLNGRRMNYVDASSPAHTFTAPDLGLNVPLPGIDANAKNQCSVAPCSPGKVPEARTCTM